MLSLQNIPIERKLILVVMLTTAAAVTLVVSVLLWYEIRSFRETLGRELTTLADVIADNIAASVDFQQPAAAEKILNALRAEQHIEMACIFLPSSERFAQYLRPGVSPDFPAEPGPDGLRLRDRHMDWSGPVGDASPDMRSGTLFIRCDLTGIRDRGLVYASVVAVVVSISLLASWMLSFRLQRFISRPVLELATTARAITEKGDYSVRARKEGTDELGEFTDTFNQMLGKIQEQDAALRRSHDELEQRVKDRTRDLELEVNERKRTEQALRVSELRFRSLVQTANDGIILANSGGGIISWNKGAEKIFGYREAEILNRSLSVLMPQRYRRSHEAGIERFRPGGESNVIGHTVELHGLRKQGGEFPLELSLTAWETAEEIFFSGIVRDITDRKEAAEKLKRQAAELARSNAELEQFAYVASHDLQEPLRMVANYTQLLARRYKDQLDSNAHEFIHFAVDGAVRMQRLINDLLEYSRVGTRGKPFVPTDCASVLGQALVNLQRAIEESNAIVTNDDLPEIMADEGQLVQLFQNLIGNAIKFCGNEAPRVHVASHQNGAFWQFSVVDNGIGIEPQFAERIFIIFQRLHRSSEYPGTGIGLSICKKIVERHGGRIWVEPNAGQGTVFHFTIPIKPEQSHDANPVYAH